MAMTQREETKMRRMEIENAELRAAIAKHMRVYGDLLGEVVTLRTSLQLVKDAVEASGASK